MNVVSVNLKDNSINGAKEHPWIKEDIEALRNLVKNEKNLKARTEDMFLLAFLRARKFDRQRAFKLLKNYYAARRNYPDIYTNFTPSSIEKCLKAGFMGYMPYTDDEGRGIAIGRASHWDTSEIHAKEVLRAILVLGDVVINNHLVQKNGGIIIIDAKTASLRHAIQITPILVYRLASLMLGAYPLRYKAIHVLNVNVIARGVISLFWPFIPNKIKNRLHLHSSVESLCEMVPAKYLPSDFGGELPPFDPTACSEEIRRFEAFFVENETYWKSKIDCD